ncbi:MAG: hypothetical protein PVG22_08880 [Chromatiales bacterium]|jgi:hypothetical protein
MKTYPFTLYCLLFFLIPHAQDAAAFDWWYWYKIGQLSGTINQPPSISGEPVTEVIIDHLYSFKPAVSDPEGSPLIFSITNLPNWARFYQLDGLLTGIPSADDIGLYEGITISVSDGIDTATLGPISIRVSKTGTATLLWAIPTTRTDGTPLSLSEILGSRIYMGASRDQLALILDLNDVSTTTYSITSLTSGTHCFAVTTYDNDGNESTPSNTACKTIL